MACCFPILPFFTFSPTFQFFTLSFFRKCMLLLNVENLTCTLQGKLSFLVQTCPSFPRTHTTLFCQAVQPASHTLVQPPKTMDIIFLLAMLPLLFIRQTSDTIVSETCTYSFLWHMLHMVYTSCLVPIFSRPFAGIFTLCPACCGLRDST
jgi:hypothetical protein